MQLIAAIQVDRCEVKLQSCHRKLGVSNVSSQRFSSTSSAHISILYIHMVQHHPILEGLEGSRIIMCL